MNEVKFQLIYCRDHKDFLIGTDAEYLHHWIYWFTGIDAIELSSKQDCDICLMEWYEED